jgi:hypothetical protein
MKTQLLAATVALSLSGFASAITINFNSNAGTYSASGVSVAATSTGTGAGRYYNSVENAIGVGNSNTNGGIGCRDAGCSDVIFGSGFNNTEELTFIFSEKVKLNSISLRQWENALLGFGDAATLTWYVGTSNTVSGTQLLTNSGQPTGDLLDTFTFLNREVNKFSIKSFKGTKVVNGSNVTAWSAFYVHSLDYSKIDVPVPAAAWMMGSGLLGLAGLARRRRSA